jgi:hypothetical protein
MLVAGKMDICTMLLLWLPHRIIRGTKNTVCFAGFLVFSKCLAGCNLRKDSSLGFSFRSRGENGLLLLSTFLGQPSGDLGDFYSVSLSRGKISVVFGHPKNKVNIRYLEIYTGTGIL